MYGSGIALVRLSTNKKKFEFALNSGLLYNIYLFNGKNIMKIKEFTYTKANGDVSKRTLVELVSPSDSFEGIDVSELDMDTYAEFIAEMSAVEKQIYEMRNELYAKYDLKHNYRKFIPQRMTDVTNDYA